MHLALKVARTQDANSMVQTTAVHIGDVADIRRHTAELGSMLACATALQKARARNLLPNLKASPSPPRQRSKDLAHTVAPLTRLMYAPDQERDILK